MEFAQYSIPNFDPRPSEFMKMQSTKSADNSQDAHSQRANLDGRYGKIGISAVAAAVRYQAQSESEASTYSRSYLNERD